MKLNLKLLRVSLIGLMAWQLAACGDLVIKVQKKPKGSNDSSLQGADSELAGGAIDSAEDYLKDMDNLRAVAVELLLKQLKGEDFRMVLRKSVRGYRQFLIEQAQKPIEGSLLDTSALTCKEGKLDINMNEANKFLGVILKSAVLAQLSDASAAAMNSKLASEAAAISQLILKEIGLKVAGDSAVTKEDGFTITTGDFRISLVPFEQDDAATQAKDASETINLAFTRKVGEKRTGEFSATISVTQLVAASEVKTHEMRLRAARSIVDGLSTHEATMSIGGKDEPALYARSTTFSEIEAKVVRVVDTISHNGEDAKTMASIIDLNELGECRLTNDQATDEEKTKGAEGVDAEREPIVQPVAQPTPTATPTVIEEVVVIPVGKPGQTPNQSPTQSK